MEVWTATFVGHGQAGTLVNTDRTEPQCYGARGAIEYGEAVADAQQRVKTIYLVNQISSHGHLDMYARVYSKCLLDLGYDVTLVAEREAGVVAWVAAQHRGSEKFNFHSRSLVLEQGGARSERQPSEKTPPLWRRALRMAREESPLVTASRLFIYVRYFARKFFYRFYRPIDRPAPGINVQPWIDDIHAAARKFGQSPSLVFFLYLDMVAEDRANRRALSRRLGAPWSGLLFHPRCLDRTNRRAAERYFSASNCVGAAFLNPRAVPKYERMYPGRVFASLPDVTDAELADPEPDLVRELRARANGRTIMLAIGSIAPHKGVVGLIEVVRAVDPSRFFFVIAGEIFWESFGSDRTALREFCENPPENCMVHSRYIESEREVNAIIAAADVLYAVYRDFKDSSNSLTKASIFEKPLLVSDGYLMAERVRAYRLGAAVTFGNVASIAAGLDEVCARPRSEFGFSAYREAHSLDALRDRLAACVKAWLDMPAAAARGPLSAS